MTDGTGAAMLTETGQATGQAAQTHRTGGRLTTRIGRHRPGGFARPAWWPVPRLEGSHLVVGPPDRRPGSWAGGPSALHHDGRYYLAYRLRRPVGLGRGYANVVAASADGVEFHTLATVRRESFGAESLERPALAITPEGRWRLYVSCATPGTAHWRVDLLEADCPERLATAEPRTVLPGDARTAVKDPVVWHDRQGWHMWVCVHPLDDPAATDRMWTAYASSADGLRWSLADPPVLAGRPGHWDARGSRLTAVLRHRGQVAAYYDGRASAAENWEERTGVALAAPDGIRFTAFGDAPVAESPHAPGGMRYLSVVPLPTGGWRLYFEATRPDGGHELRTQFSPHGPVAANGRGS